jgi:hypothetical protein
LRICTIPLAHRMDTSDRAQANHRLGRGATVQGIPASLLCQRL